MIDSVSIASANYIAKLYPGSKEIFHLNLQGFFDPLESDAMRGVLP